MCSKRKHRYKFNSEHHNMKDLCDHLRCKIAELVLLGFSMGKEVIVGLPDQVGAVAFEPRCNVVGNLPWQFQYLGIRPWTAD